MTQTDQSSQIIWLTQDAYDKLQAELEHLEGPRRAEIVAEISAARDEGDLKENGGYHAAREEQGKNEARILQLKDMLRRAEVGETPPDDGIVEPGMVVKTVLGYALLLAVDLTPGPPAKTRRLRFRYSTPHESRRFYVDSAVDELHEVIL